MPYLFTFRSVWKVPAALPDVWRAIEDVRQYPHWWSGIDSVDVIADGHGRVSVGMAVRYRVTSPLYTLHYTTHVLDFKPGEYILARASGDLTGSGKWTFSEDATGTIAIFDWHVVLTPPWLEIVSHIPGVKSIMRFFHNRLMNQGARGLRHLLEQKT